MLNDAVCFKAVHIVCGYTDLLYKRLSEGRFQWPRNPEEVRHLTQQQFRWLMEGLTITPEKSVRPVKPPEYMG